MKTFLQPSIWRRNNKVIFFTFIAFVYLVLYLQAINPTWKGHLEVDVWVWYQRLDYFRTHHSFAGLKDSEFLPATLLFLLLPAALFGLSTITYSLYLKVVLGINFLIISLILWLCRKQTNLIQTLLFLILVLFSGPIILFRFDTLVTLLVIASLWLWQSKKIFFSGLLMGWAAAMKLYPLIFLPYLLLLLWTNKRDLFQIGIYLSSFMVAILISGISFLSLGGNLIQLAAALNFHSLKYVSIESLPATVLTAISLITHQVPLPLLGGYGVWGIKAPFIDQVGLTFFNYLWIFPVGLFYFYLVSQKNLTPKLSMGIFFCLTLLFLVFAKNLNPQYIFWFLPFFPLLKIKAQGQLDYLIMFFLLLLIAYLNQIVYPLLYTNFIKLFYYQNQQVEIFYFQALRNLSILLLLLVSFKYIFIKKSIS